MFSERSIVPGKAAPQSSPGITQELTFHRVKDWIHGIRAAAPQKEVKESLESEPLYEAERLRVIYQLITNAESEGGAGITPKKGTWENVESIFPLHDHAYNKEWIKKWSTKYLLEPEDLDEIRNRLGEKVACPDCVDAARANACIDWVLLRLYPVLLHLPCIPGSIWRCSMACAWQVLVRLRHCQYVVDCRVPRVLEAPRA